MSLYQCIDLIEDELTELSTQRINAPRWWKQLRHQFSQEDQAFLEQIKKNLKERTENDNYDNLDELITAINNHISSDHEHLKKNKSVMFILDDLENIKNNKARRDMASADNLEKEKYQAFIKKSFPEYAKFQSSSYKITKLRQGALYKLGLSKGECVGFTYMMADPRLSPYQPENKNKKIDLTQEVHDYQKHQRHRTIDQQHIKRTRLTREYFCPRSKDQAERIWNFAQSNPDKNLELSRRMQDYTNILYHYSGHNSYVKMSNNQLNYAEPNHGVYTFKNRDDFVQFYIAASEIDKTRGRDFRFYQFSEMKYSPTSTPATLPSETFSGKMRTFFTGNKYNDSNVVSATISLVPSLIIGALIGGAIGSVIPIVGTVLGAVIGMSVSATLNSLAERKGHRGILRIPHLFMDTGYSVKESISDLISPKETKQTLPSSEITHTSYTDILSVPLLSKQPETIAVQEDKIAEVKKQEGRLSDYGPKTVPKPTEHQDDAYRHSFH